MPTLCWLKHLCSIRAWVPVSLSLSLSLSLFLADSLEHESCCITQGPLASFLRSLSHRQLRATRFQASKGPIEISSLFHSIFSSISLHWSLRKAFLSLLAILRNSSLKWVIFPFLLCLLLLFFSQLFINPPQTAILPFCISFSWGWPWSLPPVQCHEPLSIVLQALSLSDLIP